MARSGLQIEIRGLYRACLRAVNSKPKETQPRWYAFVRGQFDEHMHIKKKDFTTLEYHVRMGKKKLDMYNQPSIKDIHL